MGKGVYLRRDQTRLSTFSTKCSSVGWQTLLPVKHFSVDEMMISSWGLDQIKTNGNPLKLR